MGGALLQLVAYGAQDIYLTGQPQITFFKSVYRRHTNFSVESIEQVPDGVPRLNTRISYTISRNGDLLKRLWVQFSPYDSIIEKYEYYKNQGITINTIASDLSHAMLEQLEIEIGGQVIDRQYGSWLTIWRQLTEDNENNNQTNVTYKGLRYDLTNDTLYNKMAYTHMGTSKSIKFIDSDTNPYGCNLLNSPREAYVPLQFWFCRNPGLALPLIALQYHEVKITINIADLSSFLVLNTPIQDDNDFFNISKSFKIFADYVYLDTVERKQFTKDTHQYLIEQIQRKSSQNTTNIKLNFNHPVKEIIITGQPSKPGRLYNYDLIDQTTSSYNPAYDYLVTYPSPPLPVPFQWWNTFDGTASPNPIVTRVVDYDIGFGYTTPSFIYGQKCNNSDRTNMKIQLVLNGKEQFSPKNLKYFINQQVLKYHTGAGGIGLGTIGVYSFALHPEEQQPSGTCNFSMINDARLIFSDIDSTETFNPVDIYALNYNILKITSGMGGVVYSN
jgi:hypothetical protein